jgi:hypothetical protein
MLGISVDRLFLVAESTTKLNNESKNPRAQQETIKWILVLLKKKSASHERGYRNLASNRMLVRKILCGFRQRSIVE